MMRRHLWFAFWALLFAAVEIAFSPRLALWSVSPDWLLILMVFIALRARVHESLIAAWTLGITADILVGTRLGLLTTGYMLVAWVLSRMGLVSSKATLLVRSIVILFAASAVHLIMALASVAAGDRGLGQALLLAVCIVIYTSVAALPLFWLLRLSTEAIGIEPTGGWVTEGRL